MASSRWPHLGARARTAVLVGGCALVGALTVVWLSTDVEVPVQPAATAADPTAATVEVPAPSRPAVGAVTVVSESPTSQPLEVHVWVPRSVPIGGDRQVRVQVWDTTPVGENGQEERLRITFRSDDHRFTVRPSARIVRRWQLPYARFAVAARADLICGDEPIGALDISVTSLLDLDRTTSTSVELPQLDCRAAPPTAPGSVHVTDAVCGSDHEEQVSRLLDGEKLDPRRCAAHRWRNGEPRPWPPPRPAPRVRPSTPPPVADDEDDDTGEIDEAAQDPIEQEDGDTENDATGDDQEQTATPPGDPEVQEAEEARS